MGMLKAIPAHLYFAYCLIRVVVQYTTQLARAFLLMQLFCLRNDL